MISHYIYQKVTIAVALSTCLLFHGNYHFTLGRLKIIAILLKN